MAFLDDLAKRAKALSDDKNNLRFDFSQDSAKSLQQMIMSLALKQDSIEKQHKYAVVIGIIGTSGDPVLSDSIHDKAYLCDVLEKKDDRLTTDASNGNQVYYKNSKTIDVLAQTYQHKLFYPISEDVGSDSINVGDIVVVSESAIYPNHITNPLTRYDNKIINKTARMIKVFGGSGPLVMSSPNDTSKDTGIKESVFVKMLSKSASKNFFNNENFYKIEFSNIDPKDIPEDAKIQLYNLFKDGKELKSKSLYGLRDLSGKQDIHFGVDISSPIGTKLYSGIPHGKVVKIDEGYNGGYGNTITIAAYKTKDRKDPPYAYFRYQHLKDSSILVKEGQDITTVDQIAETGNTGLGTGPHLHLGARTTPDPASPMAINPLSIAASMKTSKLIYNGKTIDVPTKESDIIRYKKIDENTFEFSKNRGLIKERWENVNNDPTPQPLTTKSPPASFPKLKITDFTSDLSVYNKNQLEQGNINIKIREDIRYDLLNVKKILNNFGVPLAMEYFDFNLNADTSHMSKIGLEIHLNHFSSLNPKNNPKFFNDYYISPIKTRKIYNNGYFFDVYAKIRSSPSTFEGITPEFKEIEYYDISNTYKKEIPKIIVEKDYYINITKIFEKYGFFPVDPGYDFFKYSLWENSNWWIFQSYNGLEIGNTLEQSLEKVHIRDNNSIWHNTSNIVWNGKRFV